MAVFQRVDTTLTAGSRLASVPAGAVSPSYAWTPAGLLGAVGAPVGTWADDITGLTMTAGTDCLIGQVGATKTLVTKGAASGAGQAAWSGWNPTTSFTLALVVKDPQPGVVLAECGGFVMGWVTAGVQLSYGAQIDILSRAPADALGGHVLIFRAAGTSSRIVCDSLTQGAGPITYGPNGTGQTRIGRSSAYESGTHFAALYLWPRALSDTEMTAVRAQQVVNFPWATP